MTAAAAIEVEAESPAVAQEIGPCVHAKHVAVETARRLKVLREDADMGELLDLDHGRFLSALAETVHVGGVPFSASTAPAK